MNQQLTEFVVSTRGRGIYEVTDEIVRWDEARTALVDRSLPYPALDTRVHWRTTLGGVQLVLSETQDDPSMGARNGAGWEMCLDNLNLLLDGAIVAAFAIDVWRKKHRKYSEKFAPEFGPQQDIPDSHPAVRNSE